MLVFSKGIINFILSYPRVCPNSFNFALVKTHNIKAHHILMCSNIMSISPILFCVGDSSRFADNSNLDLTRICHLVLDTSSNFVR